MSTGWLRSNDRTMILALTFQHLSPEEKRRWLSVLRGSQSDAGEIELALRYDDCATVLGKKRGQYPERVRLVKFESSIKHDSDVVMLWDNVLTLVSQNGVLSLKQDDGVTDLTEFFKVTDDRGKICIKFKLTTNITSKSHENRSFRFTAHARRGTGLEYLGQTLSGESFDFELVAKHRSETKASKNVTKAAASPKIVPVPAPVAPAPQMRLSSVATDGLPGDLVTCFGNEEILEARVVAELTMQAEASGRGRGKRKRSVTVTRRLKRLNEHCQPGKFVSRLPLDLPAGTYNIRMINGAGKLEDSNVLPIEVFEVEAAQPAIQALRGPNTTRYHCESEFDVGSALMSLDPPAEGLRMTRSNSSNQLFKCDSSLNLVKQFSTSWPQSKAFQDDVLPPPEAGGSAKKSSRNNGLDLIPTNSELQLSYIQNRGGSRGLPQTDLTRSISEEQLAKIASNCDMYSEALVTSQADVQNITRNLWLNGPNLSDGTNDANEQMEVDEQPPTTELGRTRSMSLLRQVSEGNVFKYLNEEVEELPSSVQLAA
eukprot:TRINITY_DN63_c0_g1_i3.p1 TRINITY_DN63_c0_g1~~TRINITY_DN63_c0_g1_i3.p1  ORF type:complete len:541 (+),score=100.98 TRINITY_DN63_c0_g1_i3:463-2085(+)